MHKKRFGLSLLIVILLFCIYFFVLPIPLVQELVFIPRWALELSPDQVTRKTASDRIVAFRLGSLFGYADIDGELHYLDAILHDATISDSGFINYSKVTENVLIYGTHGELISGFHVYGYPILSESGERLFIVKTDLSGIKEYTKTGEQLWEYDFGSLITSVSLNKTNTLIGLLNGAIHLLDKGGREIYSTVHSESRFPAVYGCVISQDSSLIAVVSGLDPQILTVFEKKDDQIDTSNVVSGVASDAEPPIGVEYELRLRKELHSNYRREMRIGLLSQGDYLIFEGLEELLVLDIKNKRDNAVPHFGTVNALSGNEDTHIGALIYGNEDKVELIVFAPPNFLFLKESIPAGDVFVRQFEEHLILGCDNSLLRVDLVEG